MNWIQTWDETRKGPLAFNIRTVVRTVEAAIPDILEKTVEADRQAEIERQKWEAQKEKWRREEDQRRVEQSHKDSRDELMTAIEQWSKVMNIERFFAGIESSAAGLPTEEQAPVLERLARAREFIGSQDPLDFFRSWKAPQERYQSIYFKDQ